MLKQSGLAAAAALALLVFTVPLAGPARANGDVGEHVHDLSAHLDEYSNEVRDLVSKLDALVERYQEKGSNGVKTQQLIDWWEDVKVHGAVEVNHVPVYAAIWQGIYGVKEAIEKGKPVADVRAQQQALESAWWQGLGVVKMAAKQQAEKPAAKKSAAKAGTIEEILGNLEKVAELHAGGKASKAVELVHDTYLNLFEGIEGELIEQDADLVVDLEKDFNVTLPKALESGAGAGDVEGVIAAMTKKLRKADKLLTRARKDKKDVF